MMACVGKQHVCTMEMWGGRGNHEPWHVPCGGLHEMFGPGIRLFLGETGDRARGEGGQLWWAGIEAAALVAGFC